MRRLAGLAVILALVLAGLPAAPVAAQGARAAALAPARSPQPVRRPVLDAPLQGLTAGPGGIARSPLPLPRPGAAQTPASMVPVAPPEIVIPAAASVPAFAAAGTEPPVPGAAPAAAEAVIGALDQALAASIPLPAAVPADPRAVARSLLPVARSAAALSRHRAAAARLAAARPRAIAPVPAAQPAPQASGPAGPGLCGDPGLQGRRLARITSQVQGCGIDEPVSLTHVHGIRLSTPATLHCDAARATGRWVRDVAQPAMGRQGGGITEIRIASHYACRPRNNQRGARVSEHGRGRAIDIAGFRLANGQQVVILNDYNRGPYSAALRRMRAGACGLFRTTLGPGSDRFHADHFHFDVAQHRGGGTYCR